MLGSDLPIGQLAPFAAQATAAGPDVGPEMARLRGEGRSVYAGPGWVGGRCAEWRAGDVAAAICCG